MEEKRREEKRREGNTTLLTNRLQFKFLKILLALILSFSISCKSNEEPNGTPPPEPIKPPEEIPITPKHELEGTWIGKDGKDDLEFKIDSDGNITFSPRPFPIYYGADKTKPYIYWSYIYNGKTKTNSIVYPYTNDVSCDFAENGDGYGKFVFSSPSNCTSSYDRINSFSPEDTGLGSVDWAGVTVEFTKQ